MKRLILCLLAFIFLPLSACDNKTKNKIKTQADAAIESADKQVDKIAKQPNIVQPLAKTVDDQVSAAHSLVHSDNNVANQPPN